MKKAIAYYPAFKTAYCRTMAHAEGYAEALRERGDRDVTVEPIWPLATKGTVAYGYKWAVRWERHERLDGRVSHWWQNSVA